jgi:hypothetical protein
MCVGVRILRFDKMVKDILDYLEDSVKDLDIWAHVEVGKYSDKGDFM